MGTNCVFFAESCLALGLPISEKASIGRPGMGGGRIDTEEEKEEAEEEEGRDENDGAEVRGKGGGGAE